MVVETLLPHFRIRRNPFTVPNLSAVIITFNEERNIARCVQSLVGIADEIVVVDSFSTDRTEAICREKGVRFLQHPFAGYIEQKNYARLQAKFEYVLSLDADEAVSPELAKSLLAFKQSGGLDALMMNRLTQYCGQWVRHGGWYPDRKVRLFRNDCGEWAGINPHDEFRLKQGARLGRLDGDLLHYSYYSETEHLRQIERFSRIGAEELYRRGATTFPLQPIIKAVARFVKHYIVLAGFLDGRTGWKIAWNSARGVRWKYQQVARMGQRKEA